MYGVKLGLKERKEEQLNAAFATTRFSMYTLFIPHTDGRSGRLHLITEYNWFW